MTVRELSNTIKCQVKDLIETVKNGKTFIKFSYCSDSELPLEDARRFFKSKGVRIVTGHYIEYFGRTFVTVCY